jgi:LPS-assembly protein
MRPSPPTAVSDAGLPLTALLAGLLVALPAAGADPDCGIGAAADPRIEELLRADPDDERIEITSDTGELDRSGDAKLRGNVRIRVGQRLLTADEAEVSAADRSAALRGNVEYLDPTLHVRGQGGSFDGQGGGAFEGAEFELLDRSVRGAAESVRLRDQTRIELSGVSYTACPSGNEDWRLRAGEIGLDQESRIGTGRDVRLDFMGVPILYAPWITFPVGDQRKSGLLFPTIGSGSKTGTQVTLPWYWNIAPNYDATVTGRYMSSRGFRIDPEFRYLTAQSRGQINVEYLPHDSETGEARSFAALRNVTHFAPRTRLLVSAANVSDDNYFEDFGVGFEGTSTTYLDRSAEIRHASTHWDLLGELRDFQILDATLADEDQPYTVLPHVAAKGRWDALPLGLEAGLRADASFFERGLGPEGTRIDVEPSLGWRASHRSAYLAANASWRHTSYGLSDVEPGRDDSPDRSLPIMSLDSGLVLERDAGSRGQRMQTLEPRLLYLYIPYRDQDELPVFDTGLPDLNLVQLFRRNRYVGADRVGDANQVSVGLTTRLLDARQGRQYLSATLGQAYYFEDPKVTLPDEPVRDRSSSDLIAELELAAFKNWNARLGYQWNPDQTRTEKSEFYVQYVPASDSVVNAGYRYRRDLLEQFDVSAAWPITRQWRGFGRWVYSLSEEKTLDQFLGLEYSSCCWALRIVTRRFVSSRTGDSDTSVGLQLELKGLSSVGVDNEAFLRDSIRGYSALPTGPQS